VSKELARELINAGVHFGHGASRWNPKMAPYIHSKRGKIHIIDVRKTLEGVLVAKKLLAGVSAAGKDILFVGTKRQAQEAVNRAAEKCGMHYVAERWLGGTLTNFRTIRSRLQRLEELDNIESQGLMDTESKKQATRLRREKEKIQMNLGGIRELNRIPGAVVVVDTRKERIALLEARKMNVPTVGIIDTNGDPDMVDVAIPANDDSIRSIELILDELADAVSIGKTMAGVSTEEDEKQAKRARSSRVLARAEEDSKSQDSSYEEQEAPAEAEQPENQPQNQ